MVGGSLLPVWSERRTSDCTTFSTLFGGNAESCIQEKQTWQVQTPPQAAAQCLILFSKFVNMTVCGYAFGGDKVPLRNS